MNCRGATLICLVLSSSNVFAQTVRVPFVGCESDGQVGPSEAPKGTDQAVAISAKLAQKLAYYKADFGTGVLAPRGWHCFGTYGSSGSQLFVLPTQLPHDAWFSTNFSGAVVELDHVDGGTMGRYEVAHVIARVFPARRAFVHHVIDMFEGASDYTYSPFPKDKLMVQTDRLVNFRTPPHSQGLGTTNKLRANDDPIDGVAILQGDTPDLLMLRVRLPRELRELIPVIVHQFQ